ncbi:NAD-dependent protein deacetylase sirtuin-1-like isoform X2 [Cimex lectularius]|nr:NAD-dependent protein deacetylase sirtuin-1-like isoform X2 [Cimex lectularius]
MIRDHLKYVQNAVGVICWIENQRSNGANPEAVITHLTGKDLTLPDPVSDLFLWNIINDNLEPPKRKRLHDVTTVNDVVHLINKCSNIIVLTGAGVSVSCGIPDFRSKNGVYARLAEDFPDLPDPQAMFDINYFRQNPKPFFKFAKEIYPGQFKPSPCHRFIKLLEKNKKLLRNYTQNIDTLEKVAGINNVIECHGSFSTASCTFCGYKVTSDDIKEEIFQQQIPYCTKCTPPEGVQNVMKPDIVFFGEHLSDAFHESIEYDVTHCDLLIVIGSSLKVRPVSLIPYSLPSKVPQILINRETLPKNYFDIELLGDSDVIVDHLCNLLGGDWKNEICWRDTPLVDISDNPPTPFLNMFSTSNKEEMNGDTGDTLLSSDNSLSVEEEDENVESTSDDVQPVKCQKIGKRHIQGGHSGHSSMRDSGIGENSNSSQEDSSSPSRPASHENSFYCLRKRRYVFPGAELNDLYDFC